MRWRHLPLGAALCTIVCYMVLSALIPWVRDGRGRSAQVAATPIGATRQGEFDLALIGDLGYDADSEQPFANVLDELNGTPLAFVVHDGDLGEPNEGSCTDEHLTRRLAQFQASTHPLIYTPGDNDWTDCHRGRAGRLDPLERLTRVRELFFPDGLSLGQSRVPLVRQSQDPAYARFRENARWEYGSVTFLTLHVVGSNDNLGRTPEMDAEWRERNAANVAWMHNGFDAARRNESLAIMIIMQANIFPEFPPDAGNPVRSSGFADVRATLAAEAVGFGKPVVVVHGDSHYFRVDKPLRGATTGTVENVTRVETFGEPNHHWLLASVDPSDPNVFVFRQRLVQANLVDHSADVSGPWGPR